MTPLMCLKLYLSKEAKNSLSIAFKNQPISLIRGGTSGGYTTDSSAKLL